METPGAREAREALEQTARDEDAVRYPPLPAWFFPVMASLAAALNVVQLSSRSSLLMLCITAVAIAVGSQSWFNAAGRAWISPSLRDMLPFLAGILSAVVAAALLDEAAGLRWAWIGSAIVCASIVLVTGRRYQRQYS